LTRAQAPEERHKRTGSHEQGDRDEEDEAAHVATAGFN
jgi:hypothetical protein